MVRKLRQKFSLTELLHTFWPLFALAFFLPILSFGVNSTAPFSLFSRADVPNSMRVWIEPSTTVTGTDMDVTLTLMAELDKPKSLLSSLSVEIVPNDLSILMKTPSITRTSPFGGRIAVGSITFTPTQPGTYTLDIPKDRMQTIGTLPERIETGGAMIIVK